MRIARTLPELHRHLAGLRAERGGGVALVPTMGALHAGHVALVEAGRRAADRVVASVFVNPLQFDSQTDLARYPREESADLERLSAAGCDLAWLPGAEVMYPPGSATTIEVHGPAEGWEGAHRPGHFRGVATVCTKLFLQTRADIAVFGEKDWQQVQVIRRVVRDLDLPVRILAVPTLREPDGLALSSRNRFLSPAERARAPRLAAALRDAAAAIGGGTPPAAALAAARAALEASGFAIDYLARVAPETMAAMADDDRGAGRLIAAAWLGAVRLLDNGPAPPIGGATVTD